MRALLRREKQGFFEKSPCSITSFENADLLMCRNEIRVTEPSIIKCGALRKTSLSDPFAT